MSSTIEQETIKQEIPLPKVSFGKLPENSFQKDVRDKVDQYFKSNNISKFANAEMLIKSILFISTWVATYFLLIFNMVTPWGMFGLALLHGFSTAMIGLNIAHDAIHGAYSKNSKLNQKIGLLFNLVGANDYVWNISHNIVHHTYTNIPKYDEDIHQVPILRMEPTQKLWRIHRFQHIYAYFLYTLASISWVFIKDYVKFFQHQLGASYRATFPKKEIFRLFFYKALYYSIFLIIPLIMIDLPWSIIILGFVAAHFVEGFTMAIVFMLAHIVEGTSFPEPDSNGKINMPWADEQMYTCSNFAMKNRVVTYLTGGLNYQTEHHLFPKVCHVHYPNISKIVEETAKAHNLPYLQNEKFLGALASHTRFLKKFGKPALG